MRTIDEQIMEASRKANREMSSAIYCQATLELADYLDVSPTAFHSVVAERYGTPLVQMVEWNWRTITLEPT